MGLDDRAGEREPEPDARARVFAAAALEGLEHGLLAPRRKSRAVVTDLHRQLLGLGPCLDPDAAAPRRVLGRVLEQVSEHAFHQQRIVLDQRQVDRQVDLHLVAGQHTLQ